MGYSLQNCQYKNCDLSEMSACLFLVSVEIANNEKPSIEEAHARFVQMTLSSIVDSDFLQCLGESEGKFYFKC